jgi:hypothetical protein
MRIRLFAALLLLATLLPALDLPLDPGQWERPRWNTWAEARHPDNRPAMLVTCKGPDWHSQLTLLLRYPAPVARVAISGAMRTEGVVQGAAPSEAARAQLLFLGADGEMVGGWPACAALAAGDTPWTAFSQELAAPPGAVAVRVHVGMYLSKGAAWYRDLRVVAHGADGAVLEALPLNQPERTDTSGWSSFAPGAEDPDRPLALDLSRWRHAPAGRHGFLAVKGEGFAFADGTPARFWGSGYSGVDGSKPWLADQATVTRTVERLGRMGVNMTRLHGMDHWTEEQAIFTPGPRSVLDPARLDRLHWFIATCKKQGIYIYLDGLVTWTFRSGDGVKDFAQLRQGGKPACMFDRRMIALQQEFLTGLLTSVNPYTGLRLVDDPVLALMEIVNECSVFDAHQWRALPESYRQDAAALFDAWCATERQTRPAGDLVALLERRDAVTLRFLDHVQDAYYGEMTTFLRGLGLRIPLTGTNWQEHVSEMAASARLGFIDRHWYWDHPSGGWDPLSVFTDKPLVDTPERTGELFRLRVRGVPFAVSEWNTVWANEWLCEAPPILASLAGYQDCSAMLVFGALGCGWREAQAGSFVIDDKPQLAAQWMASAIPYLRGDVRPGPVAITSVPSGSRDNAGAGVPLALATVYRSALNLGDEVPTARPAVPDRTAGLASPDGQWRWTPDGVFILDTACTQAFVGRVGGTAQSASVVGWHATTAFAAVQVTSLDDMPIATAQRLLITATARAENSGQLFRAFRRGLKDLGTGPILLEPVRGELRLNRPGVPVVYVLDWYGRRSGRTLPVGMANGAAVISMGGESAAWYEVVYGSEP